MDIYSCLFIYTDIMLLYYIILKLCYALSDNIENIGGQVKDIIYKLKLKIKRDLPGR